MAAPDFYFALDATFRWLEANWGEAGLRAYWEALGREHYAGLTERFRDGGLPAVAEYWNAFFAEEPGGEVEVSLRPEEVVLAVRTCPALRHLRAHGREPMARYCAHCAAVSQALCDGAGLAVTVEGGGGSCCQHFTVREVAP